MKNIISAVISLASIAAVVTIASAVEAKTTSQGGLAPSGVYTTSAYDAFRPGIAGIDQSCVAESWGAAVNKCATTQGMIFAAPINYSGTETAYVSTMTNGTAVTCTQRHLIPLCWRTVTTERWRARPPPVIAPRRFR